MQKFKFPMEKLKVTQGYGILSNGQVDYSSYSHTGSFALDLGGESGATNDWLYAPCDIVVKRHYRGTGYNAVWFETIDEVMCADGEARKLVLLCIHANDDVISELGIKTGKVFKQGEKFYREGSGGGVASHVHIEVGLAPFTGSGWYQSEYKDIRGYTVWIINNKIEPHKVFILGNDVVVLNNDGYEWTREGQEAVDWIPVDKTYYVTSDNNQYFNTPDVNDVVDYLKKDNSYSMIAQSSKKYKDFDWAKIIVNGKVYYSVILEDRCEIHSAITNKIYGVDVSSNRSKDIISKIVLNGKADFFIPRVSIGSARVDENFEQYIKDGKGLKIGFFSINYFNSVADAILEADYLIDTIERYGYSPDTVNLPIFTDWEYESNNWNIANGTPVSPEQLREFTVACCRRFQERGYAAGVYLNKDYWDNWYTDNFFKENPDLYIWYANPSVEAPDRECYIWQYAANDGTDFGASEPLDKNILYGNYIESKSDNIEELPLGSYIKIIAPNDINVQYFNTPDVNDIAGDYLPTNTEYITDAKTVEKDKNGFLYYRFVKDGAPYWIADIQDRVEYYIKTDCEQKISELELKIKELEVQITEKTKKVEQLQNEVDISKERINSFETEISVLKEEKKVLLKDIESKKTTLEEQKDKIDSLNGHIEDLNLYINTLVTEKVDLVNSVESYEQEIADLKQQIESLKTENDKDCSLWTCFVEFIKNILGK